MAIDLELIDRLLAEGHLEEIYGVEVSPTLSLV